MVTAWHWLAYLRSSAHEKSASERVKRCSEQIGGLPRLPNGEFVTKFMTAAIYCWRPLFTFFDVNARKFGMRKKHIAAGGICRIRRNDWVAQAVECEALEVRRLLSTVYVDLNAPGPTHDGTSWATGFTDLQPVLQAAVGGETIDVAEGTYYPTSGTDRTATFQLKSGVEVDGGFAGAAKPAAARDVANYPTILSGDIGIGGNIADNSFHVLTGSGTDATAIIDGLIVTAGNANGTASNIQDSGGGIIDDFGNPVVRNCTFSGNISARNAGNNFDGGAGMANFDGSAPSVLNCTFIGNSAMDRGGAICNDHSSPTFTNCSLIRNTSSGLSIGGGMSNYFASPAVTDCSFEGNSASGFGGGMYNDQSGSPVLINCILVGNSSGTGGGMYSRGATEVVTLTNCTFANNTATLVGGVAVDVQGRAILNNCVLWGDSGAHGEIYNIFSSSLEATGECDVAGGYGGAYDINADPQFLRAPSPGADGKWGTADDDYGNLTIQPYSPAVDAGNNAALPASATTDIAGKSRFQDVPTSLHSGFGSVPIVDMGAYEATGALSANAGTSYQVTAGSTFTLHGLGASNLSGSLQFAWDFTGSGNFTDASGANPLFTAPDNSGGTSIPISLRVTDAGGHGVVSSATIAITTRLQVYVDSNAKGANNGMDWADAFTNLASTLKGADPGDVIEVAAGTYYPTAGTDRTATFQLRSLVEIDGGYAGAANPTAPRNITAYSTILSGDIGVQGTSSDNTYNVVIGSGTDQTAILDGFTITGGNANGSVTVGGGMYETSGSPSVRNCNFTGNSSSVLGGAVYASGSSPTFSNCTFAGNSAASGGAMENEFSTPVITNCVFMGNSATGIPGIPNQLGTGGAIENDSSSPNLTNCLFRANSSIQGGGAMANLTSSPTLTNCTFDANTNQDVNNLYGGAAVDDFGLSTPLFTNCIFWGDTTPSGDEIFDYSVGSVSKVNFSDVQSGHTGVGNINADPLFVNSAGGNLQLQPSSPCINAGSNAAVPSGVTMDLSGNPHIVFGFVDMGACEYQGIAWTGNGDGHSFADASNWSGGVVPGAKDIASIPSGALVQMSATGSTVALGGVFIAAGGLLDLANSTLVINFTGSDPASALRGDLQSAYNQGAWTGTSGLTSSVVAAQFAANKGTSGGIWSIGYADGNADGAVGGAGPNQIVISAQLVADANEDGKVDFDDLLTLAQNLGSTAADWVHGDFNFDGVVDFNDLLLFAQNNGKTNGNTPLAIELPAAAGLVLQAETSVAVNPVFSPGPIIAATDAIMADDVLDGLDKRVLD